MHCKELESVLETEGLGQLPKDARLHLATCGVCQGLLADLNSIASVAKSIPAEVNPPERIWISLRAQLETEGLIKEPVEAAEHSSWWESFTALFRPRAFATAGAGVLVLAIALFVARTQHTPKPGAATNQPVAESTRPVPTQETASVSSQPAPVASLPASKGTTSSKINELAPSPSESASFTLNQAELEVPNMQLAGNSQVDLALRQNLRTLNAFIAECELHLKQNPQDELAREYLNTAYQQKADLLAAMMESGRGDN
jgi:hypothetical protein